MKNYIVTYHYINGNTDETDYIEGVTFSQLVQRLKAKEKNGNGIIIDNVYSEETIPGK